MSKLWILSPTDSEISSGNNWQKIKPSGRAIGRHHLMIVQKETEKPKRGPVYLYQEIQPGTEYVETSRIKKVNKYTAELQESLSATITTQLTEEIISKIGSQFKVGVNLEGNLNSELQSKITNTLTKSMQHAITTKETFSIEIEEEKTNALKIIIPEHGKIKKQVLLTTHYMLREYIWEVFLIQSDFIHLTHKSYIINWLDIRKTISNYELKMNKPLFKVIFYIPENRFSNTLGTYKPEVQNEREIIIKSLNSTCPPYQMHAYKPLEKLAQIAFPVNKTERIASKKSKEAISGSSKGKITKKAAPKKAAPKKAAPKKAAPKKAAPKKAAPKKAAPKKAAPKKAAPKKAAPKKAAPKKAGRR